MKRFYTYLMVPALALVASCSTTEEIEFSHEQQAFETRSDKILIEGIMPQASAVDEEIYIIGEFNGGDAAIGNPDYLMTHSSTILSKWGVYLDPSKFVGGKTLADGFTFYSVAQGYERSSRNEPVTHTLNIGVGEWANVYADKWEKYFEPAQPVEEVVLPELDGYGFFVDNSDAPTYAAMALYAWGSGLSDTDDLFGGWPGMQPTGTWDNDGVTYTYFDLGSKTNGLTVNFILNNNGGGAQLENFDVFKEQVIDHNFFFKITDDDVTVVEIDGGGGGIVIPAHDGVRVWIDDQTGWDAIALYQWGDVNNFGGDWPGAQVAGTAVIGDVEYKYFEYGDDIYGLAQNLIFNNNGNNAQLADVNVVFEEGVQDYFFLVTPDGATLTDGPGAGGGGETPPTPPVEEKNDPVTVYVQDLTGWDALYLYMWGDKELCGGWPGMAAPETTVKIGTETFTAFVIDDAKGRVENFIFNNNDGTQTESYEFTLSDEIFVSVDAEGVVTEINPREADIRILVNNKTDWDAISLYAYGDSEAFGGWPGAAPIGSEVVGGVTYTVFGLDADKAGQSLNLIFNNNGGGKQLEDFAITVPEDEIFLAINANYYVDTVTGNPRGEDSYIYVLDNVGWGADLHMYAWGDAEIFGGWAGAAGEPCGTFRGIPAYRFFVPAEFSGKSVNLIFNNGSGGDGNQFDGPAVTVGENLYYEISNDGGFACMATTLASRIYVLDETDWENLYVYVWGTSEIFGGWPGTAVDGEQTIGDVTYKYADVPAEALGNTANIIFNNNAGTQLENFDCLKGQVVSGDFFFHLTPESVSPIE